MKKKERKLKLVKQKLQEYCTVEELLQILRDIRKKSGHTKMNPALQKALDRGMRIPLLVDNENGRIGVQLDNVVSLPRKEE